MTEVSVVVPIKDESGNIRTLAAEIDAAMNASGWQWECIWIDDGSTDDSLSIIKTFCAETSHHRYLSFEANAGQSAAMFAGFQAARGSIIATLDGDGQNDPADLPRLIELVRSGNADMANGYRQSRQDAAGRKWASTIANGFRTFMTGKTVRDVGCSTRAFRRECTAGLPCFKGMHRFLPTFAAMRGFRLSEGPVNHRPRSVGTSKYTINNRLWVGLLDTFGVLWLRIRCFQYRIAESSDDQ